MILPTHVSYVSPLIQCCATRACDNVKKQINNFVTYLDLSFFGTKITDAQASTSKADTFSVLVLLES